MARGLANWPRNPACTLESAQGLGAIRGVTRFNFTGWLPGHADSENSLRLLFHSARKTNEGGFSYPPFDDLIEQAPQERRDRDRLELFLSVDLVVDPSSTPA